MYRPARIALIHAVQVAIQPVEDAFVKFCPQAERINLFDDSLARDRERDRQLTDSLTRRIVALADYAFETAADGVLLHAAPILKPLHKRADDR